MYRDFNGIFTFIYEVNLTASITVFCYMFYNVYHPISFTPFSVEDFYARYRKIEGILFCLRKLNMKT